MIVRAAAADALIHVPRGEGEIARGRDAAVPPSRLAEPRDAEHQAAAALLLLRTAHSDRTQGPRPGRRMRTRQARRAPLRARRSRPSSGRRGRAQPRSPTARAGVRAPEEPEDGTGQAEREEERPLPEPPFERKPEPGVERREDEDQRIRLPRARVRGRRVRAPRAPSRAQPAAPRVTAQPTARVAAGRGARQARTCCESSISRRSGGSLRTSVNGASGSGAPVGNTPAIAPSHTSAPAKSARPSRVRSARSAGREGERSTTTAHDQVEEAQGEGTPRRAPA